MEFTIRCEKWYADALLARMHYRAYRYQLGPKLWWFRKCK